MSEKQQRISYLLEAYVNKTYTHEELDELLVYIQKGENEEAVHSFMEVYYLQLKESKDLPEPNWEQMLEHIVTTTSEEEQGTVPFKSKYAWVKYAAASILVITVGITGYFFFNKYNRKDLADTTRIEKSASVNDVVPATDKAILTLANGSQVILDSTSAQQLQQPGAQLAIQQGKVQYKQTDQSPQDVYNTITTPRGGQYHLVLADGTKVWLNAASSISFPVAFSGNKREVSITGEAYFEVVHKNNQPFFVKSKNQVTEDLGTAFNIQSYDDNASVKTTLVEGAIKVNDKLLHPGEQAINENNQLRVAKANMEEVTAWRKGLFYFANTDFQNAMKVLGRWYDLDIVYKRSIPDRRFEGKIPNSYNLGDVLAVLRASDVHFSLRGKTLTVEP